MSLFEVEIVGGKEAARFLKQSEKATREAVMQGLAQAGFFMEKEVKNSVSGKRSEAKSVDTGRFLGSIASSVSGFAATISTNVSYAKFLEFGTSRLFARSHFRNSLALKKQKS